MNLIPALVADLCQGHRRRWAVINGNGDITGRMKEIEIRDVQKVSKAGGTAVAKDTAALSAVLSGRMSFDAEETRRRDEHDGAQEQ